MAQPVPKQQPFIIGIGASAGGLEALLQLLDPVFPPTGCALVVVQHVSPDHRSLMVDLLSNHTKLQVTAAVDGVVPAEDTVYVLQPQDYVRLHKGRLAIERAGGHVSQPINILFKSLAQERGPRCAGVVLSGTGRDGAEGLETIKKVGGVTVVQRPDTARFDGMPQAALNTGCVDLMLSPSEIVAEVKASQTLSEPLFTSAQEDSMALLGTIFAALRSHTGMDFSHYKPGTIARRVERRMAMVKCEDLAEYAERLKHDLEEAVSLREEMFIGVTAFMRDTAAFQALQHVAIPRLLGLDPEQPLRVWVAGCSTGEEAYSVAMLLDHALTTSGSRRKLKVFATDIDDRALEQASLGQFSEGSVQTISAELRDRYLQQTVHGYVVRKRLRECLLFSRHNVITDPVFPRVQLVSCRNLLIYFKPHIQQRVLTAMSNALVSDGLLWLGSSESLGELHEHFEALEQRWKFFRAKPGRPRVAATLPTPLRPPPPGPPTRAVHGRRQRGLDIAEKLLQGFLPPTIVTDEHMMLIYRYGNLEGLLEVPVGPVSLDLRDILPRKVSILALTACQRIKHENREVIYRGVVVETSAATSRSFDLRARPLTVDGRQLFALMFDRLEAYEDEDNPLEDEIDSPTDAQRKMKSLERDLRDSQATLQSTVKELESSNERLHATNEELVASNEELQSVNEELQSVNEELHTVNAEHAQRLDELVQITQDLDQLLSALDVGVIFLDARLTIRRFNLRACNYVNLLLQDIGRPLSHLSCSLDYPALLSDCERVMHEQRATATIVSWRGHSVRVRLNPFASRSGPAVGLVISIAEMDPLEPTPIEPPPG